MFLEEKSLLISQHEQNMNCVLNLQTITEKLLFSMNIPQEIATKYNFLKQQTYETLGLHFQPGVITYVPPPPSSILTQGSQANHNSNNSHGYDASTSAAYSSTNYMSTGGIRKSGNDNSNNQLFSQMEEILRSLTEHLSNMTKGIILEEDNSFIQESLSKKFLEPLSTSHQEMSSPQNKQVQLPKDFLNKIDSLKQDFDQQIRKLINHFNQQREEMSIQNDRKLELLKQENNKYKVELEKSKGQRERDRQECMCKFYEENLMQIRDEHSKYVTKLKQKYENEIYEIRTNLQNSGMSLDHFRNTIFSDMKQRIFAFVQEKNANYIQGFCQDQGGVSPAQIDPIELLFYIIQRMESDNNWLVDKLAEVEEEKRRLMEKSQIDMHEDEILNGQLFADLIEQTKISDDILENFAYHRDELIASLETTANFNSKPLQMQDTMNGKENQQPASQLKRHNFPSAANLRESLQSTKSISNYNNTQNHFNNKTQQHPQTTTNQSHHNHNSATLNNNSLTGSMSAVSMANMLMNKSQSGKNLTLKHSMLNNNKNKVIDDESAILNGTLNAMIIKDQQENYNSNMSYKQGNNLQVGQNNNMMYNSIEFNQSHRVMLGDSTDYYNEYK